MEHGYISPSRFDYTYRLLAAKVAIQKMRINRSWQRLQARQLNSDTSAPTEAQPESSKGISPSQILVLSSILLALAYIAIAGYWLAHRENYSRLAALSSATDKEPFSEDQTSSNGQDWEAPADWKRQTEQALMEVENKNKKIQLHLQSELIKALQGELAARIKADSLSSSVDALRARIGVLTDEMVALRSELLQREGELADAEYELQNGNVEHRVVYNITNIPLGTHVSEADLQKTSSAGHKSATTASQLQPESPDPVPSDQLESEDNRNWQEGDTEDPFQAPSFGPAPDRIEDVDFSTDSDTMLEN